MISTPILLLLLSAAPSGGELVASGAMEAPRPFTPGLVPFSVQEFGVSQKAAVRPSYWNSRGGECGGPLEKAPPAAA